MNTNLTNCDVEPIHQLGCIQSQGYIIAVDISDNFIKHISDNFSEILQLDSELVLGKTLDEISKNIDENPKGKEWIVHIKNSLSKLNSNNRTYFTEAYLQDATHYIISHSHAGLGIVEIEEKTSTENLFPAISSLNDRLINTENLETLLDNAVNEIRKLIDFDRVMIYKFLKDDSGTVVAESSKDGEMQYLGLRFPESDIPKQARSLYIKNRIRFISDARSKDIAVYGVDNMPIDLTNSVLRSVSKMHIQYLANMGVQSSFSISIIYEGKLWGLVACHNSTQKHIDYQVRNAAKFVADYIGNYLKLDAESQQSKTRAEAFEKSQMLIRQMASEDSVAEGLLNQDLNITEYIPSDGGATYIGGNLKTIGRTPEMSIIKKIVQISKNSDSIWETENLSQYGLNLDITNQIAGCLVMRMSADENDAVIWFREEVLHDIEWAGEPVKQFINKKIDGLNFTEINPRKSFEIWKQSVKNTSSGWTQADIAKAKLLGENINFISLRRSVALERSNLQLQRAYSEMDNFMNSVSHDLTNPLSVINLNAQSIIRKEKDEAVKEKLGGIIGQVGKISNMLLQFRELSKTVSQNQKVKEIEMPILIFDIFDELIPRYAASNTIRQYGEMYNIKGNEVAVYQIFSNIISNAIKYSSHRASPIVRVESTKDDNYVQYRIYDNGIGIDSETKDIFEAFVRLDSAKNFEGSGIGLSIVKSLVIRQNATINYISCDNEGTCFYITFFKNL